MKDKLRKLAEDYTVSTEAEQALYNDLCILFGVSKSFYCNTEQETGKLTECKQQCSYCRCK